MNTANERATLIKLSLKRLQEQAKSIEQDIARDSDFIEDYTEKLQHLITDTVRKSVEQQIAERMRRVDNLRVALQMIALMQELLTQEQKRLATVPQQASFEHQEGGVR